MFVVDLQKDYAEGTAKLVRGLGRRAVTFQGDVREPASMEEAAAACVRELGSLDFAVSNAGIVRAGSVLTMPVADWKEVFDINVNGTFNVVKVPRCWHAIVTSPRSPALQLARPSPMHAHPWPLPISPAHAARARLVAQGLFTANGGHEPTGV